MEKLIDIPFYFQAIDVWNVTCMTFIFGALLEFAVVNVLSRKSVTRIIYDNVEEIQTISRTITNISLSAVRRRQVSTTFVYGLGLTHMELLKMEQQ